MAIPHKKAFPKTMSFRVCIYPSEFDPNYFTAHCLELDVIGQDNTVEGAVAKLLEAIETQLDVCVNTGAQFEFWAPGMVWYRYEQAKRAGRKIAGELLDRIIEKANKQLGYESPINIDAIAGTKEVMKEWPAAVV